MAYSTVGHHQALGVGDIIGNTFSIFFGRFGYIVPLALIPAFAMEVITYLLVGKAQYGGDVDGFGPEVGAGGIILILILQIVGPTLATAFVILAAYDAKLGRAGRFGHYLTSVMQSLVPVVICSLIVAIGIGFAMIALIVPGVWLYGVWCVVIPAIVIEKIGFGGLSRSAELTRDYRWPCLGALILIAICMGILVLIVVFVVALIIGFLGVSDSLTELISAAIGSGLGMGLSGVCVALIYARLREITEGTSVEQIADVFA